MWKFYVVLADFFHYFVGTECNTIVDVLNRHEVITQ